MTEEEYLALDEKQKELIEFDIERILYFALYGQDVINSTTIKITPLYALDYLNHKTTQLIVIISKLANILDDLGVDIDDYVEKQ